MPYSSLSPSSAPIIHTRSQTASVYGLFALAMTLTLVGVYAGIAFAPFLLSSGVFLVLLLLELALILTSRWWVRSSPLNYLLFALFPLFSGFTVTPFLLSVIAGYVNGAQILLNAAVATTLLTSAAAVFAYTTSWDLGFMGRTLFLAVIGLVILGVLQLFIPAMRTGITEVIVSGLGVLIFAFFTAYDLQRIQSGVMAGSPPILLALSLYLDIFNMFLYVVRVMLAMSGNRR